MNKKPWLLIISGPNGAGKSTFYENVVLNNPFLSNAIFLNYDEEIKKLKSMPEYSTRYQEIAKNTEYKISTIQTNAAITFKKQMEQIGGPLNERINQPIENKEYWYAQYRLFTSIPFEWEHIKPRIYSKKDLAKSIGGQTIHERINAKAQNNTWYPIYKKLVHNPDVQKTIVLNNGERQIQTLDNTLRKEAIKHLRQKINSAFEKKQNIIFETTGAGILRINKQAKNNNYNIFASHICVLHPEISVSRVQQRVQQGGHDVPTNIIFQRYQEYMDILPQVIPTEDIAIIIDNSGKKTFMPIFTISNGHITNLTQCPEYLRKIHNRFQETLPGRTIKALLHLSIDINVKALTDEQRENFGQIVLTNLLTWATPPASIQPKVQSFLDKIKTQFLLGDKKKQK